LPCRWVLSCKRLADREGGVAIPPLAVPFFRFTDSKLQFAKAAGARVIATTSSPEKEAKVKQLGADHVINYKKVPNWGEVARGLTPGGEGVDHVIEVGGGDTIEQSFKAIKYGGVINIIGFLGGLQPKSSIFNALTDICTIRGIYVGSRAMMQDMVSAIEVNNIHPVVDERVFSLSQAREAYEYMVSGCLPPLIWKQKLTRSGAIVGGVSLRKGSH
jgi:NADPH:quinone reductase-like Zn-dependent oxidoreductase